MGAGGNLLSTIFMAIGIAILVYTIRLYKYTKENPFTDMMPLTIAERKQLYFNESSLYQIQQSSYKKQCICENQVLNDFCTEEQIKSGCKDLTLNPQSNKKLFLRYLMDQGKCSEYRNSILDLTKDNLSQVFNLKFDMIHKMTLGLLILLIIALCIFGLLIISGIFSICCGEAALVILLPFMPCIIVYALGSGITELVLFIILCVNYGDSKISEYVEFLDCAGVNKAAFEKYSIIKDVKETYTPFMILYIIYLVLSCCQTFVSSLSKKEE